MKFVGCSRGNARSSGPRVAEEELDLLQFAAGGATESSATPPKVVRRKFAHTDFRRELLDEVPNELLRHHFAPNLPSATNAPEEATTGDSSGLHPVIEEGRAPNQGQGRSERDLTGPTTETTRSAVSDNGKSLSVGITAALRTR